MIRTPNFKPGRVRTGQRVGGWVGCGGGGGGGSGGGGGVGGGRGYSDTGSQLIVLTHSATLKYLSRCDFP